MSYYAGFVRYGGKTFLALLFLMFAKLYEEWIADKKFYGDEADVKVTIIVLACLVIFVMFSAFQEKYSNQQEMN